MRRGLLLFAVAFLVGGVLAGAVSASHRAGSTGPSCTDFAATGDIIVGSGPLTGLTKLTFTCSGAAEVKGGPYSLQIMIVTSNGYTCAANPDLDNAHPQGAWTATGHSAVTTASTFANRGYTVGWVNCVAAGAVENTSTEVSSCGLKVDVTLSLQQGYGAKNVEVASAKGIVAGCHTPGPVVAATATTETQKTVTEKTVTEKKEPAKSADLSVDVTFSTKKTIVPMYETGTDHVIPPSPLIEWTVKAKNNGPDTATDAVLTFGWKLADNGHNYDPTAYAWFTQYTQKTPPDVVCTFRDEGSDYRCVIGELKPNEEVSFGLRFKIKASKMDAPSTNIGTELEIGALETTATTTAAQANRAWKALRKVKIIDGDFILTDKGETVDPDSKNNFGVAFAVLKFAFLP